LLRQRSSSGGSGPHVSRQRTNSSRSGLPSSRPGWEHLAWEEAQGRLQQQRTALEGAQATLKQRDDDVSWLNGELGQLSISHEDLRQSHEEQ
jgi:hypothetical protein